MKNKIREYLQQREDYYSFQENDNDFRFQIKGDSLNLYGIYSWDSSETILQIFYVILPDNIRASKEQILTFLNHKNDGTSIKYTLHPDGEIILSFCVFINKEDLNNEIMDVVNYVMNCNANEIVDSLGVKAQTIIFVN